MAAGSDDALKSAGLVLSGNLHGFSCQVKGYLSHVETDSWLLTMNSVKREALCYQWGLWGRKVLLSNYLSRHKASSSFYLSRKRLFIIFVSFFIL